jgi:heat shock protein HtpX
LVFRSLFYGRPGRIRTGSNNKGKGGGGAAILIAVAVVAVAWILSIVIRFALSRSREYLADAGAVELTKNPDAMITALRKIENRGELEGVTSAVMEMCVDNPRSGFADLFATHPPIARRIAALVEQAGGRDPGPIAQLDPIESPAVDRLAASDAGPWGAAEPQNAAIPPPATTGPWGPRPGGR